MIWEPIQIQSLVDLLFWMHCSSLEQRQLRHLRLHTHGRMLRDESHHQPVWKSSLCLSYGCAGEISRYVPLTVLSAVGPVRHGIIFYICFTFLRRKSTNPMVFVAITLMYWLSISLNLVKCTFHVMLIFNKSIASKLPSKRQLIVEINIIFLFK